MAVQCKGCELTLTYKTLVVIWSLIVNIIMLECLICYSYCQLGVVM